MAQSDILPGDPDLADEPTGPEDADALGGPLTELLTQGLRLNLNEKEASTEAREDLVPGKYRCHIIECNPKISKSEKNPGKPMYEFVLQVNQEVPKFGGNRIWTTACLWEGALYTIVGINKALGIMEQGATQIEVLPPADYIGQELIVKMAYGKSSGTNPETGEPYPRRLEAKGFFPAEGGSSGSSNRSDFLP
jgi:hypothetical protein